MCLSLGRGSAATQLVGDDACPVVTIHNEAFAAVWM